MPMPAYPVRCLCGALARVKIAARWSDGITHEFKTYYLACTACTPACLAQAQLKRDICRLTPGESLDQPVALPLSAAGSSSGG
jgi:hypothetical protein